MSHSLPYPRIITGDIHAHERHGRSRMKEVSVLVDKLTDTRQLYQARTLIINGDLFDRNTPLAVDSIVMLAQFFNSFERTVIVVGNHDTPIRASSRTMLDIFRLVGATVITTPTIIGKDLFVPYYEGIIPHPEGGAFEQIHMHKDIAELNYYLDQDFGISLSHIPPCGLCFNGHLHKLEMYALPNGGTYVQMGAPYPTSWSDLADSNNSVWVATSPTEYGTVQMMITGDDLGQDDRRYSFLRTKKEKSEVGDTNPLEGISMLRSSSMSIEDVLGMTSYDPIVNKIIRSMVSHAVHKIDAIRI